MAIPFPYLGKLFLNAVETQHLSILPSSHGTLPHPRGGPPAPLPLALALLTVALPLANPTPLPFTPRLLNMGAFLFTKQISTWPSQITISDLACVCVERENAPKHIRHNEEPNMRTPNIDLIQMAHSPIACGNSDVFELHVHVIFRYIQP